MHYVPPATISMYRIIWPMFIDMTKPFPQLLITQRQYKQFVVTNSLDTQLSVCQAKISHTKYSMTHQKLVWKLSTPRINRHPGYTYYFSASFRFVYVIHNYWVSGFTETTYHWILYDVSKRMTTLKTFWNEDQINNRWQL